MRNLHVTLLRSSLLLSALSLAFLPACDPDASNDDEADTADEGGDGDGDGDGDCTALVQEDVDADVTLQAGCYTADALLAIDGTTLTLDAGVSIRFGEFGGLSVFGTGALEANGTADDAVELRASSGTWMGLTVLGGSASLTNVELSGAGTMDSAALTVSADGEATIADSLLDGNEGAAFSIDGLSNLTLDTSTVSNNGAIGSVPFFTLDSIAADNLFEDNDTNILGVSGSSVDANLTIPAHGVPLLIEQGSVTVTADITVSPGVEMRFVQDGRFTIAPEGTFNAAGTADMPIVLRGEIEERGYWKGMSVQSKSSSNVLDHVELAHGGASNWNGNGDSIGAIWLTEEAKLQISNSVLRESGWYALISNPGADIEGFANNSVEDNERAINVSGDAAAMVDASNAFTNNEDENVVRVGMNSEATINNSGSWMALSVPYFVSKRLRLNNDVEFEAGADITVAQDVEILVQDEGTLAIRGADGDRVTVRGAEDLVGYWQGISYASVSASNVIESSDIRNAGASKWTGADDSTASLYLPGGSATLQDALISTGGGYGVHVSDGMLVCQGVTFENVASGPVSGDFVGTCN